ncbi:diguanylate cyclase [Longimicrobium terrae]|uniref:diguanylate cyclase n=1 Tax=Longimicrobium terrae TaxID=1639882 RepID=A0A841H197_9BACT|nr:diguanylate cyclase [Longimicrobium terrae]MBB4637328.1 diguanylate cyclase (GGDEF)-like protein [Longimicrobium terrae]MBB6071726.1 diguanylate cyclase (GGDEF)-like protein [Longimicrobium terrae]NNC28487.1 GGDEF domain-containing protein [Longimicrobium terrae]
MQVRRSEDRRLRLVLAQPTGWITGGDVSPRRPTSRRDTLPDALEVRDGLPESVERGENLVLLLDGPDGEGVLVTGAVAGRVPQSREIPDLMDRAAVGAAVFLRERNRTEKRQRLPDQLIGYFEELNAADTEPDVLRSLATHALRIVGAYTSVALARETERGLLRAPMPVEPCACRTRLCIAWDDRFAQPGLLMAEDARPGGTCPTAAGLFGDPHTVMVAHVPVGESAVLVLAERRDERIFEPEDWDVLRALALQAEMSLRRIRLLEEVRTLSLTDPLTGLGNRRHMELMLAQAWAAAGRGESLAVLALDLDGFKQINDARGHHAGDELLCAVAQALRSEARAADIVVRCGGDEFLAILPGGTADGAQLLAERVRRRLDGQVGITAGVAVFTPETADPEALIREADRRLCDIKARRRTLAA